MNTARKPKQRTCKAPECENQFTPFNSLENWCSPECGAKLAMLKVQKAERKKKMIAKRERIAMKKAFREKDIKWHKQKAVATFNRWISKVRDVNDPCISSGRFKATQWQAGHYVPATCAALRFDPANVHKQSSEDNLFRSGNLTQYRIRLIDKIGLAEVERLEGPQPQVKFTVDDYKQIREHYAGLLKEAGVKAP